MIRITIPINSQVVSRTMDEFGTRAQVDMVIEECAELIQAIQAHKSTSDDLDTVINDAASMIKKIQKQRRVTLPRSDVSFGSTYEIADEMADVLITIAQVAEQFKLWPLIQDRMNYKVARAKSMIQTPREIATVET